MSELQNSDSQLKPLIAYLLSDELPFQRKQGKDILIESQDYVIDDGMLFHFYYPRGKQRDVTNAIKQLVIPSALRQIYSRRVMIVLPLWCGKDIFAHKS